MEQDLDTRVLRLEQALRRLEAEFATIRSAVTAAPPVRWSDPWPPPLVHPPLVHPPTHRAVPPTAGTDRSVRTDDVADTETVLKWVGIGLVVLAVGFAVSTAIRRGWIGPEIQLAAALCATLAMVGAGVVVRTRRPGWTQALCSGGTFGTFVVIGSELFTTVADPVAALAATVITGLGGFVLADLIRSEWVAMTAVTGWVATWFTIESLASGPTASALAAIPAGLITASLLARRHPWPVLLLVTHVVGMLAGLRLATDVDHDWQQATVVVAAAALAVAIVWQPHRQPGSGTATVPATAPNGGAHDVHVLLAIAMPVWLLAVAVDSLDVPSGRPTGVGALILTVAAIGLMLPLRHRARPTTTPLLVGAGITCAIGIALALPMWPAIVLIAVQAAGLAVLSVHASDRILPGGRSPLYVEVAVLGQITLLLATADTLFAWLGDRPLIDDLARLGVVVVLGAGARSTGLDGARRPTAIVVSVFGLVWLGSVLVHLPQGQAIVSIAWATAGIGSFVVGATRKVPAAGTWGLTVLAVTVGKLLTIDLAEVDTLWRAALFLVIGLGILRLGYLLPRLTGARQHGDDATPDP